MQFISNKKINTVKNELKNELKKHKNEKIYKLFLQQKTIGNKVIILSATPNFLIEIINDLFRVEFHCSVIKKHRYKLDMTGEKQEYINKYFSTYKKHLFVSDNQEDFDPTFENYLLVMNGELFKYIKEF